MTLEVPELEACCGRNRVVLVFAPSPVSDAYLTQKRLFSSVEDGLRERDLLVFYLFSSGDADTMRSHFGISEAAFALVLIGKDGGEKEHSLEPVQPEKLFGMIDQMPMRRQEMQKER